MKLPKSAFSILGIPQHFYDKTWGDTKLLPTKQRAFQESISRAPISGLLLVAGTSAPIVNQMFDMDRKVIGISFPEVFDDKFNSGDNEGYPNSPVVLIYDVGLESAKNKEFSMTILNSIISYYKARETLLIIETPFTISNFQATYGLLISNTMSIPQQEDVKWVQ